ncbi:MAG: hypothetical protein LBL13_02310 [Bacteroidales bacterium]|jgi:hypothetical protein|nr:hypothetical protein [Bacteroidales bacterium]
MLSRKKKQNLLHLGAGILIGVVVSAFIAYFGVISNFTKKNIVKIYKVFPDKDIVDNVDKSSLQYKEEQISKQPEISISDTSAVSSETEAIEETDTVPPGEIPITIKTDIKIAEELIPIMCVVEDSLTETKSVVQKGELSVEQWENPTNFAGYRKSQNKLIVYGIDIDNIGLQLIGDGLYLIYYDKKLLLKDSDSFLHYPAGFIK